MYCWLVLLVPLVIAGWFWLVNDIRWRRVQREEQAVFDELESRGRYLPWSDLEPRLEAGDGTLIYEIRAIKGLHLIWWTEDDIIALSPTPLPGPTGFKEQTDELLAFAARCVCEYTDIDCGTATVTRFDHETALRISRYCVGATPAVTLWTYSTVPDLIRGHALPHTFPEQSDAREAGLRAD